MSASMRSAVIDTAIVAAGCAVMLAIFYLVNEEWLARGLLALVGFPGVIWLEVRHHRLRTA